jgi:hypothetical protein
MIGMIRSRVSSAHLIGVVALVFAVGGGIALANVPNNSVTSKKVKNNSLKGVDIRNNTLTGADIKEASLNGAAIPGVVGPPAPPPGGATSVSQRIAPNSSASISAGGFTLSETTDAAGLCNVESITAAEAGRFTEDDGDGGDAINTNNIAAGASVNFTTLGNSQPNTVHVLADDGSGGGFFTLYFANVGGRCNFAATAIGA